jgi:hypothetical protein
MPYVDKNDILHSYQYAFEQLTPGKWLMGKYLVNNNNQEQGEIQKPLEDNGVSGTSMQYPLSVDGQQGTPQLKQMQGQNSYAVPATKENIEQAYNNNNGSGQSNNNTGASFFEGGSPKKTVDTSVDSSDSGNRSQEYFNMKVNQMKSGH